MTKKHVLTYTVLLTLYVLAYPFGREILIQQEPSGYITISNFTLNYLLLFVLAGAISPWLASKLSLLKRFRKSTASGIVMLTLVSVLLIVLRLFGMDMRF